jgi:hypothetical protein
MDDFGSIDLCRKCRKRCPDEKQTKLILRARRTVGQTALENHAKARGYEYCVCPKFESIHDLLESEKCDDALSHDDNGFQVIKRSVGLDRRISRPPWYNDDLATYLVLYSQYPPNQVELMHELVCKHLRGTEPMGDKVRKQMQRLREKGNEFFSQGFDAPVFVFDAARHSHLLTLKSKGHILRYDSWEFVDNKPRRYKMHLSDQELGDITSNLEVLVKRFEDSPHEFPFMSAHGFKITPKHTDNRFLSRLRRLCSFRYLVYVCRALFRRYREKIHQFWKSQGKSKRFADLSIAAILVFLLMLYSSLSYCYYRLLSGWVPSRWYDHHVVSRWGGPTLVVVDHHLRVTAGRTDMLFLLLYPLAVVAGGIEVLLLLLFFWLLFDLFNPSGNETELRGAGSHSALTFRFTKRH